MNIDKYKHKNNKIIDVVNYGKFYPCNNPITCNTCLTDWNYKHEWPYIERAKQLLTQNSIGIDVGAHVGMFSIALKKYIKTMYSFEPQIYAYDALCYNAGLYQNIIPIRLNCGDISNESPEIPVVHLDPFFNYNIEPNFVKIDVEGQEIKVLNGMKGMLNKTEYMVVILEFEMKHLVSSGYTSDDFWGTLKTCGLDCTNFVEKTINPILKDNLFCNVIIHKNSDVVSPEIFERYYN